MATNSVSVQQSGLDAGIAPGSIVGGRIKVERTVYESALYATLFARDTKTRKAIALKVLSSGLAADDSQFGAIREEIRKAANLKHRSIVATYGVGTHPNGGYFVAHEWVEGSSLSGFVASRRKAGQTVSVRAAYNVVTHVCKALEHAATTTCHGALRPSVVWITRSGRIKVGDFGLSLALAKSGKWKLLEAEEQAFLAPEVKLGNIPDSRSDIFGIGSVLYVLLTGRSPTDDFVAPSAARPDATAELDRILMKCLATDPQARYASPLEVSQALLPLVAEAPVSAGEDFGVEVEIDVDIAASLAPPAQGEEAMVPPGPAPPPEPVPVQAPRPRAVGAVPFPSPDSAPSLPRVQPHLNGVAGVGPTQPRARESELDISSLLKKITENDAPRWMAVKDGLDHGPFSGRELVQLIVKGEVLESHSLLNMDTGERKPVREFSEFAEFVEQHKIRRAEQDHQKALERSSRVEKQTNVAKWVFLAAGIGVVALATSGYLMTRQAAREDKVADVDLATMFETGQVKITGTAGILKYRGGRRRASRRGGSTSPSAGGGYFSYEDAMNRPVELGDATRGGGERQLRSHDIARVMNRRLNSLFGCVSQELRRGGRLGKVTIDLAIAGSGQVQGASVRAGSGAFQGCIVNKVRHIKFPGFPAPRMGARFSFDVN